MRSERSFPRRSPSVTQARRFVVASLAGKPTALVDAAELMVSELATNCILHAGTGFTVAVDDGAEAVRIEVSDPGSGRPALRTPAPTEATGRGLWIVAVLSQAWGIEPAAAAPGKTVWFTVGADARDARVAAPS